jgi:glycosyltransferase involved in cell wall biosynthesis
LGKVEVAWKLLFRHARNAGASPTRLLRLVARMARILVNGELPTIIRRHQLQGDLYRDYPQWAIKHDALAAGGMDVVHRLAALSDAPLISVLMPVRDPEARWLRRAIGSVRSQQYPNWQLCVVDDASEHDQIRDLLQVESRGDARIRINRLGSNVGIAAATNAALAMATGSHVAFLDHDDELSPDALGIVANAFVDNPRLRFVYTDEDRLDADGQRIWPVFKPAWNPDFLLANNYITHLMVTDARMARDVGGMRSELDGAQDWDFALRVTEQLASEAIGHIPRVLYHWRSTRFSTAVDIGNKGYAYPAQRRTLEEAIVRRARGETLLRTDQCWRVKPSPGDAVVRVSIIVPTRNRGPLLRRCIQSVIERNYGPRIALELVIVDNGTIDGDAIGIIENLKLRSDVVVINKPGLFNFSRLVNAGVAAATGDVVVLLNNDTYAMHDDWLEEIVGHAMRPEVGAVGAMLLYDDGTIQHAGIVLGVNGIAEHFFRGYPGNWSGVNGRVQSIQDLSAVTGACIGIRRDLYIAMGGMDEALGTSLNDIDFCVRLRSRGYRVVWTPFAILGHQESMSRGYSHAEEDRAVHAAEADRFRWRWDGWLIDDPAYNPNLARAGHAFALGTPVPARDCRARTTRQTP